MSDLTVLIAFIAASLVVLLIPGPGVVYVVARTVSQGLGAGLLSVLGVSAGALVHVVAATLGLSAVLLASAAAFDIVKALGAAYLIYLGIRALRSGDTTGLPAGRGLRTRSRVFTDGVIVSALNPKLAMFFMAFLPQFVDPNGFPAAVQMLVLGLLYVSMALLTDGAYALLATRLQKLMRRPMLQGSAPRYASGAIYIGMGVGTALIDRQSDP